MTLLTGRIALSTFQTHKKSIKVKTELHFRPKLPTTNRLLIVDK
jgi:hypothetical protein